MYAFIEEFKAAEHRFTNSAGKHTFPLTLFHTFF